MAFGIFDAWPGEHPHHDNKSAPDNIPLRFSMGNIDPPPMLRRPTSGGQPRAHEKTPPFPAGLSWEERARRLKMCARLTQTALMG